MMKNLLGTLAVAAALATPAMAADMPLKAPPPPIPVFTWTGVYGGGFIGGMWTHTDNSFVFPPPASFNQSASTGIGGGIIGAQYQWNSLVLGVEGNLAAALSRTTGSAPCNPAAACAAGTVATGSIPDGIFTIGPRAGWAIGRWMPYVTGGYAVTSFNEALCFGGPCETGRASHNGTYIGGGVDWAAWGPLVLGFEYRHYSFETLNVIPLTTAGAADPANTYTNHPRFDTAVFRLTYLFNGLKY
jgi:outer membrane immunogenic protein